MKKLTINTVLVNLIIVFFASCQLNVIDSNSSIKPNSNKEGTVTFQIPAIPQHLINIAFESNKSITSNTGGSNYLSERKAIGFAMKAEITISDGIKPPISYSINNSDITVAGVFQTSQPLPEGTGYTATVDVFNTVIDPDNPIISGTSDPFDITAGSTTNVYIVGFPNSPINLNSDTTINIVDAIPSNIDLTNKVVTKTGGEYWFIIDNIEYSSTAITISHDPTYGLTGIVELSVFDNTGTFISSVLSPKTYQLQGNIDLEVSFESQIGESYYICVLPLNLTDDITSEFSISYSAGPDDDAYDVGTGNDVFANATPIAENTPIDAVSIDDDYYIFTLTDAQTILINCLYNIPTYAMTIELYDESENFIDIISSENHNRDSYGLTLDSGTYYILVKQSIDWRVLYTLSWEIALDDIYEGDGTEEVTINENEILSGICFDSDSYAFTLDSSQDEYIVYIEVNYIINEDEEDDLDMHIELYNEDDYSIAWAKKDIPGRVYMETVVDPGTYYINIDGYYYHWGMQYDVSWHIVPDDVYENNDDISTATDFNLNPIINGVCRNSDYFKLTFTEKTDVRISFTAILNYSDFILEIINGLDITDIETHFIEDSRIIETTFFPGTFYILIRTHSDTALPYQLSWDYIQ